MTDPGQTKLSSLWESSSWWWATIRVEVDCWVDDRAAACLIFFLLNLLFLDLLYHDVYAWLLPHH